MHIPQDYSQALLTLPPSLTTSASQYCQLKLVTNQIILELAVFGLNPAIVQELLRPTPLNNQSNDGEASFHLTTMETASQPIELTYEFINEAASIHPFLRLAVKLVAHPPSGLKDELNDASPVALKPHIEVPKPSEVTITPSSELLSALRRQTLSQIVDQQELEPVTILTKAEHRNTQSTHDVVMTLIANATFHQLLLTALESLSSHRLVIQSIFLTTLEYLAKNISLSARPMSSISSFHPLSASSDPNSLRLPFSPKAVFKWSKSDLYFWREIFQIYIESSPFESINESTRGERTFQESEARLRQFAERITKRGLAPKLKQSRHALETMLQLNIFILYLKKFQYENGEAARKILKNQTPISNVPSSLLTPPLSSRLAIPDFSVSISLPRILAQAICEVILPVIPHVDDYACLICTNIAFKPIRLTCGHLFCVRCLVRMQRGHKGDCPLCRAPTVLIANRSNVDWALMNFMKDWFSVEAKSKLRQNERDAAEEEMRALGFNPGGCVLM